MIQSENTAMQKENVNITLSIPVSELSGLVPVNYKTLAKEVLKEIDMEELGTEVKNNLDLDDLASDVKGYIDIDDLASDVRNNMSDDSSVEDKIQDMLESYDIMNGCNTAQLATKVMIEAIRYDITTHLYGSDKSKLDVTMTSVLRKFIQQEIVKNNEEASKNNETFTFGQVVNVLDSMTDLDFNTKLQITNALNSVIRTERVSPIDIIIKAD